MKKITLLLTLLVSFAGFAQFPAPYCGPMTFTTGVEPITSVNFAGIVNTSSAVVGVDNGTTRIAHEDYTAIVGNVNAGSTYPITLKGNTDGAFTTNLRVYVDWNQNNDFTDAGESYDVGTIVNSTGVDAVQLVGNIVVPANALAGNTRMRVIKRFNGYGTSCQVGSGYGQAEDYTVTVAIPSCPAPFASLSNVTSSTTANLSWTSGGASNAEIVVQLAGAGLPALTNDTGVNVTGTSYAATLLLPQTAYEFYVRDECVLNSGFSTWSGPFVFNTTQIPGCATNLTPLDGAVGVAPGTVTFSWNAPTTGDAPLSYDLFYGLTPGNATILVGNFTTLTTPITITGFNTTFYWKIVPKNVGGSATGCPEWSFTTGASPGYCLTSPGGQWPTTTYTPVTCDGIVSNSITANGYAGEYSVVTVTSGQTYTFTSSVPTDLITISTDAGVTAAAFGTTPVTWVSTIDGTIRFYNHTNDQCGTESVNRTRSVICGIPSTDAPDYVNLQFPANATINRGGSATVYGRVYEAGLTDITSGQAPGITAWVGISPVGSNTNPNTWTNWIPATFNVEIAPSNNDDEYQATIGATLTPGTYYYATRFQLNNGAFVYGGYSPAPGGSFWDGTTYISGILTVNPSVPVTPNCDLASSVPDPSLGGSVWDRPLANGTGTPAIGIGVSYHVYGPFNVDTAGSYTFTSTQDYDGFIFVYQNSFDPNSPSVNYLAGNDDSGPGSVITTNLATATNYYFVTTSYSPTAFGAFTTTITGVGTATCGTLAVPGFNDTNFSYYPNPVKNSLNLSYNQEISNVDVFNLLGQKVIATKLNANSGQIDMSSLPKGTYMVKVTSNNQVKTIKVIKQ
ncbi:T9SS type A sorting domain-containing protein [Flavobacterium sp.]|uniref:T9SS type A sorting domain-containing protein n=1 Tax=Flavobacterium sp. TaxID=239 RepID=UPI002487C876|nr:T9SS type A sorting domain-containing protein [Flavobacterium sp.]MDI1316963.1 T9SS type A sorting domain-containing protein [Flavobacterium sp.]